MTLVELITILAVGSILIVGLVLFVRSQVENSVRMRDFQIGVNLARLKMADANNIPPASLAAGTYDYPGEPSFPGFKVQRKIALVTQTTMPGGVVDTLWRIDMLVDYVSGDFSKPLVGLITYRQNHATFSS